MPDCEATFASNLKAARAAAQLSCQELGDLAGMGSTAIWKSEGRGRRVSVGEAYQLCKALGVSLDRMLETETTFTRSLVLL